MATRSAGYGRRGSDPACPHVLLDIAHGHALQRHRVGGEIVGVPVLEGRRAPAEVTGDHEPSPLDHLGVGGRELLRRVVALIDHHALVLAGEVVLDDPPVHGRVADSVPQAAESGAGPRAVVVPDARPVFLDGDAHAREEIPAELRAEHAGQVMAAAPLGRPRRWDAPPGAIGEGAGEPRPVAAIGGPGPLAAVRVDVLEGVLAHVVALGHVAAETVAHEDRMLALGAAGDEATARHHHRVTVHVVHVRIHGVLEGDLPVAPPLDLTDEDEGVVVEELLGHVLLDGRGRVVPDPDEDEALEGARGIDLGLRARLAAHARVWALGEDHGVLARLVVDPAVVRAGHRALVVAVTLAESRAAVRTDVLDGDHVALGAPEEADLLAEERDLDRLTMPDLGVEDGRIPIVSEPELGNEVPDVAGELGHGPVGGASVRDVQPRRWRSGCRHDGLLWPSGLEQCEALVGVERPRLDEVALIGLAAELLHGADQHVPVEHLLLARGLDGLQGALAPGLVVAHAQRLVEAPVLLDVGIKLMVLVGEEGVRPARGGDERRAPRASPHHARGRRANFHTATGARRRRIERVAGDGIGEAAASASLGDDPTAVAIDLEGDHPVGEADAIVVEEHDRVEEGVSEPGKVERLVGLGHVHALLEETRGEVLARRAVARDLEYRVRRLRPGVGSDARLLPRPRLDLVVGENTEGRDDVLGEVLVLIVAPDDDHLRLELVEATARLPELADEGLAVAGRARRATIGAVLAPHRLGPARGITKSLGEAGILENAAKNRRHVLVATGEGRVVRQAEAEDLTHERSPPASACKRLRNPSLRSPELSSRSPPRHALLYCLRSMRSTRRRSPRPSRRRGAPGAITQGDVARAARVAVSTVSRALAGEGRISRATRRRVERAAHRLGYAPNALARGLAGGGANVVAVVIPRTAEYTFTSPFHLAALKGISRVLQEASHLMLLSFLEERDFVALHRSGLCRGVIVLMFRHGDRRISALARHRVPAVLIPGDPSLPGVTSLTFDATAGSDAATRHLLVLGHRRIGFIGGVPSSPLHRARLAAFREALAAAGVAPDPSLETETNFTAAEAYERALDLLRREGRPTALVCSNDVMAQAAHAAAQKLGLQVPADLSIAGLAGLPGPRLAAPALATVIVDFEQVGATAATLLLKLIADRPRQGASVLLPVEFDPGGSTAPPPSDMREVS